ncbi:hypothetical protein TNCV_3636491 [Trichonephila clavipes]|nr:hypothetical protein TNCV_3636491 [Trichonephila clavipes]
MKGYFWYLDKTRIVDSTRHFKPDKKLSRKKRKAFQNCKSLKPGDVHNDATHRTGPRVKIRRSATPVPICLSERTTTRHALCCSVNGKAQLLSPGTDNPCCSKRHRIVRAPSSATYFLQDRLVVELISSN